MEEELKILLKETKNCNACLELSLYNFQNKYGLTNSEMLDLLNKCEEK